MSQRTNCLFGGRFLIVQFWVCYLGIETGYRDFAVFCVNVIKLLVKGFHSFQNSLVVYMTTTNKNLLSEKSRSIAILQLFQYSFCIKNWGQRVEMVWFFMRNKPLFFGNRWMLSFYQGCSQIFCYFQKLTTLSVVAFAPLQLKLDKCEVPKKCFCFNLP